jgi:hypothetical protein
MARPRKNTSTATDSNTITVAAAATQLQTTEQALRLALMDICPDDFDTVKTLSLIDFEAVAKKIQQQLPAQNEIQSESVENPESLEQREIEPATDEPQKTQSAPIVPQPQNQQQITNPTQPPTPNTGLSVVEMLARQAQEEITAVDGILQVRNALVLNTLSIRNGELAEGLNQRWQGQKQGYVGVIRDLAELAQESPQFTPDTTDITAEINDVLGKLKNLTA